MTYPRHYSQLHCLHLFSTFHTILYVLTWTITILHVGLDSFNLGYTATLLFSIDFTALIFVRHIVVTAESIQ